MNLLVLKNLRSFGSDGLLLRAALNSGSPWHIIALVDSTSHSSGVDEMFVGSGFTLEKVSKGDFLGRFFSNLIVLFRIVVFGFRNKKIDIVVCGSVELAVIVGFSFISSKHKYYLFSDLTRFHLGRFSNVVRYLESRCVSNGWIPCVTSPGFLSGYLKKLKGDQVACLVHNVEPLMEIDHFASNFNSNTIVWTGLLRCSDSLSIFQYFLNYQKNFNLKLAGSVDCLDQDRLANLMGYSNVDYLGRYSSIQLNSIYSNSKFSWCCDWSLGVNSELLLTNRIYQSIASCVPIIASSGSFSAKVVEYYKIGLVIPCDPAVAFALISSVDEVSYKFWVDNLRAIATKSNLKNIWHDLFSGEVKFIDSAVEAGAIFN